VFYTYYESAIGPLLIAGDDSGLRQIGFPGEQGPATPDADWQRDDTCHAAVVRQLDEYFAGDREHFDLKLNPSGTEFQLRVLEELQKIPYGETSSYSDIANRVGRPAAVRAVGAANGRNPIPIIIPCHRVIGKNGQLTGFAGGLPLKQRLLELESRSRPLFATGSLHA
jgi:methylated-DNA-[protein]-cysteine S-methyltransferase